MLNLAINLALNSTVFREILNLVTFFQRLIFSIAKITNMPIRYLALKFSENQQVWCLMINQKRRSLGDHSDLSKYLSTSIPCIEGWIVIRFLVNFYLL